MAANGGHLGSNLGAVELTLALHRVFDSPHDAILWDTGHQAYVHKIVTGRQAAFEQLRQAGGLSGYPSREESRHDYVENSHASTILSYAYGLACARDAGVDDHRHIVAVIGDGSMTGGMAYEALNNLGHSGRKVIIVLNDNGRSYAPDGLEPLREPRPRSASTRSTCAASAGWRSCCASLPLVGRQAEKGVEAVKAAVREYVQPAGRSSSRSVCATSARSTATTSRRWSTRFRNATEFDEPIVVHVLTQKGRGYPPAEDDDEKHLHDAQVFDPRTGPPKAVPTGLHAGLRRGDPQGGRASTRGSSPSPPPCPGRPGSSPSRTASRTASSTSASPSSTPSPLPPAWPWAACARSWPSTPRS